MTAHRSLTHVYGIARAVALTDLPDRPSEPEGDGLGPPRRVACGDLAAVVGAVAVPRGASFDDLLRDNRRAERLILRHHGVLDALMGRCTVLPLRFGTVFVADPDDRRVKEALACDRPRLTKAIDRIDGAIEWGLKVYCARDRMGRWLAGQSLALIGLDRAAADADQGKAFFLRRRAERLTRDETDREIARCLAHASGVLLSAARASVAAKVQPAEVHGRQADMVFNGAYLVDCRQQLTFFDLVDELSAMHATRGLEYETTGPWPPYSFAAGGLGGDGHGR